ncbi:MAG: ABC-F family ATP-binding cassette domain-containing protein, partial [Acidimicrobiia bacterium]
VGRNGVGKTTLLRIVAGLDAADGGSVRRDPPELTVGYLPQEPDVREGETLLGLLARRSGTAEAEVRLEEAATALAEGGPRADDAYAAALDHYLALGGPDFHARAGQVCANLGLPPTHLEVETASLSGGQAARASLASILLSRFDVFLLDEPTNDLDFAGLARLEQFLNDLPGGVVVVSHDRAFLDRSVERVVEIDEHSRTSCEYGGGWAGYLEAREVARRHAEEAYGEFTRKRSALVDRARQQKQWAVQGVCNAKKNAPDNDKAQRDFRINRTEKLAGKVKITEKALDRLEEVDKPWEGWKLDLAIAETERSGDVVARLSGAVVERGSFALGPLDVEIAWAERVAILGPNGSGKTTLLNAMLGRLPLSQGEQWLGPGVVVGELDQRRTRHVEGATLLEAFCADTGLLPQEARSLLAKFGLSAAHVARPADRLSPGERTRGSLATLMARGVNCLVLDEPTNHLDLPAIEQLEQALSTYTGTLLLVTHDRQLLDAVAITRTIALGGT